MTAEAAPSAPLPEATKKRKKKRKAAKPGIAAGREDWPSFAQAFPQDPELEQLVIAFEQGNYARVREGARQLLAKKEENEQSDSTRKAAAELLRRIEPDPIAVYMLVGAIILLAFLSLWYWLHLHNPPH